MEALATAFLLFLVILLTTVTTVWANRTGIVEIDESNADSWWGRPIRRSDYEPSEANGFILVILAVLFGGFFLTIVLVDFLFEQSDRRTHYS